MGKIKQVKRTFWKTEDGMEFPTKAEAITHDLELQLEALVEPCFPEKSIHREWVVEFLLDKAPELLQILQKKM